VFEPDAKVPRDAPPPREPVCAAESFGRLIQGPVQFYQATAYTLRGNTVISVDPPGKTCPIYQREYYRGDVRWRTVSRFVSSEHVQW
jgi:hypothetical protein